MNEKQSFLKRLKKVVASHIYDLGHRVLDEGIENAKELHDVEIPKNKKLKDLVAEVVEYNAKAKKNLRANISEMKDLISQASKQAVAALKNNKEELTSEEDKFLESLGLDDDDMEDFDFGEDEEGMDFSEESISPEDKDYTYDIDVDKINSKIMFLLQTTPAMMGDETLAQAVSCNVDKIENIMRTLQVPKEDRDIKPASDKLERTKEIVEDNIGVLTSAIGIESDDVEECEICEELPVVVEVVETELPLAEHINVTRLKAKINMTIDKFFESVNHLASKPEVNATLSKFMNTLDAVTSYLSAVTGKTQTEIESVVLTPIKKTKHFEAGLIMYLDLVPEDLMEAGRRIVRAYQKIENSDTIE